MQWEFRLHSMVAIGGISLAVILAASRVVAPAQAQAVTGFNPLDPQWALATGFGFNAGTTEAFGANQQAYMAKLASGTVGFSVRSGGVSGNFFGPGLVSPMSERQDWFADVTDPAWRTSVVGSYKSNPNETLLGGLYTTASFGLTSIKSNPSALPGLANLYPGNDAVGVSASAGLGLQLTPQISIEGAVGYTQGPGSPLRRSASSSKTGCP
jgi:hypothetical protein